MTATLDLTVHRAGPVRRTLADLLGSRLIIGAWLWAIALVVAVAAPLVVHRVADVGMAIVPYVRQAGIWLPFSVEVAAATTSLAVHVASGMTRRTFVRATLACTVIMATVYALLIAGALRLEQRWYDAMGWDWVVPDSPVFPATGPFLGVVVDYGLTFLIANVSGLLVGIVYYTLGGWRGTLLLPLTAGPVIAVMGWYGGQDGATPYRTVILVACLGATAAMAAVFRRLTLRAAISTRVV